MTLCLIIKRYNCISNKIFTVNHISVHLNRINFFVNQIMNLIFWEDISDVIELITCFLKSSILHILGFESLREYHPMCLGFLVFGENEI